MYGFEFVSTIFDAWHIKYVLVSQSVQCQACV